MQAFNTIHLYTRHLCPYRSRPRPPHAGTNHTDEPVQNSLCFFARSPSVIHCSRFSLLRQESLQYIFCPFPYVHNILCFFTIPSNLDKFHAAPCNALCDRHCFAIRKQSAASLAFAPRAHPLQCMKNLPRYICLYKNAILTVLLF